MQKWVLGRLGNGVMEEWNVGMMECWVMGRWGIEKMFEWDMRS